MKTYAVHSIFYTLQGEGINAGRPAVFCRFTGCNLWSGLESGRRQGGSCAAWCDTEFFGTTGPLGLIYETETLANVIGQLWPEDGFAGRLVVFTGGEPLLQLDRPLIAAVHAYGFEVAVESNGTLPAPEGIDWLTVSPKAGTEVVQRRGDELKLVYPQDGIDPAKFLGWDFQHFILSPMDGPKLSRATASAVRYCKMNPRWRLGIQVHKAARIP